MATVESTKKVELRIKLVMDDEDFTVSHETGDDSIYIWGNNNRIVVELPIDEMNQLASAILAVVDKARNEAK